MRGANGETYGPRLENRRRPLLVRPADLGRLGLWPEITRTPSSRLAQILSGVAPSRKASLFHLQAAKTRPPRASSMTGGSGRRCPGRVAQRQAEIAPVPARQSPIQALPGSPRNGRRGGLWIAEQKLALRAERPRFTAGDVLINAPDRGGGGLRAAAARAVANLVGACFVVREAAGADELLHRIGQFGLAKQDAVDAARRIWRNCQAL